MSRYPGKRETCRAAWRRWYYNHREAEVKRSAEKTRNTPGRKAKSRRNGIDNIGREYAKKLLIQGTSLRYGDLPDALIEAKRAELKLKRALKGVVK